MLSLTDDVLFGAVWRRAELAPRDRSLDALRARLASFAESSLPPQFGLPRMLR